MASYLYGYAKKTKKGKRKYNINKKQTHTMVHCHTSQKHRLRHNADSGLNVGHDGLKQQRW